MSTAPDLIVTGGVVPEIGPAAGLDATRRQGRPSTVAVRDGLITAVGADELLDSAGPATRVIDAKGGAILPGLNDGHLHFAASATARHLLLPLGAAGTWDAVKAALNTARPGADGWIRAHGWDETVHGPVPANALLDAAPDHPAVAYDQTGHQLLVNAAALRALGLTGVARSVDGGVTGTLPDGGYSGHFADAAMALVNAGLPPLPAHTLRQALLTHQAELHALGLTSYTEPGLGPGGDSLLGGTCGTPTLEALVDLAASGELSLRATVLLLFNGTGGANAADTRRGLEEGLHRLALERGVHPERLNIAGVKVFADGTPRSGTAWMSTAYESPCGHGCGHLAIAGTTDEERETQLGLIIDAVHAAGLQAGVHATGDAATLALVGAVERAQSRAPRDARHYVIHGAFPDHHALARLHAAGMGYSTNPAIRAGAGALMRSLLGQERFDAQQPLARSLSLGLRPNIASDAPVTTPDWRSSVTAAVTRNTSAGPGEGDPERLSLAQALFLMTGAPAWQDHAERRKGAVRPGLLADLTVLSEPLPRDVSRLAALPATHTVVGGRLVHQL
jgi:predicted amidohydrolase YtcJ